jgi:hypothetical protein
MAGWIDMAWACGSQVSRESKTIVQQFMYVYVGFASWLKVRTGALLWACCILHVVVCFAPLYRHADWTSDSRYHRIRGFLSPLRTPTEVTLCSKTSGVQRGWRAAVAQVPSSTPHWWKVWKESGSQVTMANNYLSDTTLFFYEIPWILQNQPQIW